MTGECAPVTAPDLSGASERVLPPILQTRRAEAQREQNLNPDMQIQVSPHRARVYMALESLCHLLAAVSPVLVTAALCASLPPCVKLER